MNLRDRPFEKSLWSRVRRELRGSPTLWREYRRTRPGLRRHLPENWLAALIVFGVGAGATFNVIETSQRSEVALAAIAFWFVGSVGYHTRWLFGTLYEDAAITPLYHLPLTDADIFRVRWRVTWRTAVTAAPIYAGVGVALASSSTDTVPGWLTLFVLPSLQYLLALVMALHLAAWAPGWHRPLLAGYALAAAVFYGGMETAGWSEPLVQAARWVPPFGWLNHALAHPVLQGDWMAAALLIPIGTLVAAAPISWRRLRVRFQLGEPTFAADAPDDSEAGLAGQRPGTTELADSLRSGEGLRWGESIADAGWLERLVFRWWTPRERIVAEFFATPRPGWSRGFLRMTWIFLPALAILLLFSQYHRAVVVVGIVVPVLSAIPVLGGYWPGFAKRPTGGQYAPMFALYPIGFGEALRMILKANFARLAAAAPFLLALVAAASWRLSGALEPGLTIGTKALALYSLALPLVVVLRFSESTNDTNRLSLGRVLLLIPLVPALLGGGTMVFLADTTGPVVWGMVIVAGAGALLTGAYMRAWAKGRFDLLSPQGDEPLNTVE